MLINVVRHGWQTEDPCHLPLEPVHPPCNWMEQTGSPLILYMNENLIAKVQLSFRNQKKEATQGTNTLVTSNLLCVRTVGKNTLNGHSCRGRLGRLRFSQVYSLILWQQKRSHFLACIGLNCCVLQLLFICRLHLNI